MRKIFTFIAAVLLTTLSYGQSDVQLQRTADLQTLTVANQSSSAIQNQVANGNLVMIRQVGNQNAAFANISSSNANVRIAQRGSNNNVALQLKAKIINENIVQLGSNNTVKDYALGTANVRGLQLIQRGNNLSFERIGVNSTSSQIKVQMQGNSKSVIIRSFR